jgi:hypothetical protein
LGTRRLALRRQEDRAPTGGAKSSSGVCWRWRLWLQSDLFRFPKLPDTSRLQKQILHVAARIKSDPNATFQKRLKLRAGITVLTTRTHLTSLVRQLWVAFWGEQQAVVGTRRDGLYFCPQEPNPLVTPAFASLSQNQEGCCIELGRSPCLRMGPRQAERATIRSRQLLAMVRLRNLAGRASISPQGFVWIARYRSFNFAAQTWLPSGQATPTAQWCYRFAPPATNPRGLRRSGQASRSFEDGVTGDFLPIC